MCCPLCRQRWTGAEPAAAAADAEDEDEEEAVELPFVPDVAGRDDARHKAWVQAFGEHPVSCFLADDWMAREAALRRLQQMMRRAQPAASVMAGAEIVDAACQDPVFKVYDAALAVLAVLVAERNLLATSRAHTAAIVSRIVTKAGDCNRRTQLRSLQALDGLLGAGRTMFHFFVQCLCDTRISLANNAPRFEEPEKERSWRWWVGRLSVLTHLLEHHTHFFSGPAREKPRFAALHKSLHTFVEAVVEHQHKNVRVLAHAFLELLGKVDPVRAGPAQGPAQADLPICIVQDEYVEGKAWTKGQLLGAGVSSAVFAATDVATQRQMAVKQIFVCNNASKKSDDLLKHVQREIEILSRLPPHPNVISFFGSMTEGLHAFYIFLELAPTTIAAHLCTHGPFAPPLVQQYTDQVAHGLAYLHATGIVHRDLKGSNLCFDPAAQRVMLCDFGAATQLAGLATEPGEIKSVSGTCAWMAPEVWRIFFF